VTKRYDLDVGKRRMRKRWRAFITSRIANRKKAQILCFPGENGFEIEQCYRPLGFRDENIWGIEREPDAARAIADRYPDINLFQTDLIDFVKDYDGPPFDIVSLDYCGNFGRDKIMPLAILSSRGLLSERCCLAVNLMAGREKAEDKEGMRQLYGRYLQNLRQQEDGRLIGLDEALELVAKAGEEELSAVRDSAMTQAITSSVSYLMPALRVAFDCELEKAQGTAFVLSPNATKETDADGRVSLQNVRLVGEDRMTVAQSIKHEAILHINDELASRGITEAARRQAQLDAYMGRKPLVPVDFFEYHVGRTIVMMFYDQFGHPDFPYTIERYAYISESGKRMISDFVETRKFSETLDRMPTMVAPLHHRDDPEKHRFALHPEPDLSTSEKMAAYIKQLAKAVYYYADNIAKHLQRTEADSWKPRVDLGGGDSIPVDEEKLKARVIELVKKGRSTEEIALKVPYLQPGTIRAIRAHVSMGSYDHKKKAAKANAD
jgi:hypothetical protein